MLHDLCKLDEDGNCELHIHEGYKFDPSHKQIGYEDDKGYLGNDYYCRSKAWFPGGEIDENVTCRFCILKSEGNTLHYKKVWPEQFNLINQGRKTFEVRIGDTNYHEGDLLVLQEFDKVQPRDQRYTGRQIVFEIGSIMHFTEVENFYNKAEIEYFGLVTLSLTNRKETMSELRYDGELQVLDLRQKITSFQDHESFYGLRKDLQQLLDEVDKHEKRRAS